MKHFIAPSAFFLAFCAASAFAAAQPDTRAAAKEIDGLLQADWQKHKLQGNPAVDDNTFVRRIYLDIIGRIPTTRETEEFLASKDAEKRARLIDKLLGSEAYVQHSFNYWADVLRVTSNGSQTGAITGAAYSNFVKDSLRTNKPYDQFVKDMVAAQGKAWTNGAIGYYMRDRGMPLDNMANTVRVFLGTRIECAQCHNHPFDKWSQMQFFKMAAFTYGVSTQDYYGGTTGEVRDLLREQEEALRASFKEPQRPKKTKEITLEQFKKLNQAYELEMKAVREKREAARAVLRKDQRNIGQAMTDITDTMRYTSVDMRDRKVTLPHDYQYTDAKPKSVVEAGTMMGHECITQPGETPLQAYARWMTSPENPRFTTVIVNRLWKRAFGLALIEPLDELMDTTVPMNADLQKHLEKLMVSLKYDMKAYMRVLYNTSAYQRQVTREEHAPGNVYHFTGPLLRRMSAEQMWDSFVTLINPNPDMINQTNREAMEQRILQAKKNANGVDSLSAEEMLEGLKATAAIYGRNREKSDALQKLYTQSREIYKEARDKAEMLTGEEKKAAEVKRDELKRKSDDLGREMKALQNQGRTSAIQTVIVRGQKKLYEEVTGKPYQTVALNTKKPASGAGADASMMMAGGEMMMMDNGVRAERVIIPGYDRKKLTPEELKAQALKAREAYAEEGRFYGIAEKQLKDYFNARERQTRTYLRAAEQESPAPRGHPLRDFGQSDRETIENANNDASVPQSLFLLNGNLMPEIINKYSQLMLTVNKAQYPDDKVEAAYMTLLSRKPTVAEKQTWLKAQDSALTMDDLVFSLLNTQQFIFIQ
ncbi:MAG: DUF1549 domain-containing protein [Prosthecobacter sp.]